MFSLSFDTNMRARKVAKELRIRNDYSKADRMVRESLRKHLSSAKREISITLINRYWCSLGIANFTGGKSIPTGKGDLGLSDQAAYFIQQNF